MTSYFCTSARCEEVSVSARPAASSYEQEEHLMISTSCADRTSDFWSVVSNVTVTEGRGSIMMETQRHQRVSLKDGA